MTAEDKITSMIEDTQRALIEKQQKQLDEAEALLRDVQRYQHARNTDMYLWLNAMERIDAWLLNR
jgi:hypothetical protein